MGLYESTQSCRCSDVKTWSRISKTKGAFMQMCTASLREPQWRSKVLCMYQVALFRMLKGALSAVKTAVHVQGCIVLREVHVLVVGEVGGAILGHI